MSRLITVPTFTFSQGDVLDGAEMPVQVAFYDNDNQGVTIGLSQLDSEGTPFDGVSFTSLQALKALVKSIEKHLPQAKQHLKDH